ncbi:hypothetical protein [Aquamicrobium soli]|jgi:hypothetical protein|uniref:Uncharacterized protein n=1 Tax=Aquamicrobium soli TaxID=1811518 RepID=A0ABV7K7X0_9HYPH
MDFRSPVSLPAMNSDGPHLACGQPGGGQPTDSAIGNGGFYVGLLGNVAFEDLAEDDHGLADETAQFVVTDRIEVLFRIHQIDKKVHAPLVQPHPSAFPGCSVPNAELVNEYGTRKFRAILPQSMRPGFGRAVDARLTTAGYFFGVLHNLR